MQGCTEAIGINWIQTVREREKERQGKLTFVLFVPQRRHGDEPGRDCGLYIPIATKSSTGGSVVENQLRSLFPYVLYTKST
jgi:hypothetical protein